MKKKNKRMYFDEDVQNAIVEYNSEQDPRIKNKIYADKIAYALDKLCENIINTFKFSYFDAHYADVKQEVLSFLVLNLHKYDHTKGFKAFSYFSIVAKNYLISVNNNNYKKLKSHNEIDSISSIKELSKKSQLLDNNISNKSTEDLMTEMIQYFEQTIPKIFKKERDILIAYSILELLKKRDEIENFNKKSLYILIREMTNVETIYITKVVNIMKKYYKKITKEFYSKGDLHQIINQRIFF